MQNKNHTLT